MKSIFLPLAIVFIACSGLIAQTGPVCTFNYQAVVRDAADKVIPNRNISVRLSVLDGPGGGALYIETHTTTTNSLGLFTLEAGGGTRVGGTHDWMAIPWVVNRHFLKVEADINGGQNYEVLGESPVLAVPIAVHAKIASLAYQTIDTITKVVQTLCADSLKSKISCLDTIKTYYGHIDTLISKKIYATDLCVDTIKIVTEDGPKPFVHEDGQFPGGIVVHVDRMDGYVLADTIDAKKILASDVCAVRVNLINPLFDTSYSVLKVNSLDEKSILCVDEIEGEVRMDSINAKAMCIDSFLNVKDENGNVIFWVDYLGLSNPNYNANAGVFGEFYADTIRSKKVFADELCPDEITTEEIEIRIGDDLIGHIGENIHGKGELLISKVTADSICAKDVLVESISMDIFDSIRQILYFHPLIGSIGTLDILNLENGFFNSILLKEGEKTTASLTSVNEMSTFIVDKIKADEICSSKSVSVTDSAGVAIGLMSNVGENSFLFVDKIFADDVCTKGLLVQSPDGTRLLEVNPLADIATEYAFTFNHNIMVNGGIMAEFKQFVIDHPLDPENKTLRHFSIESDQMMNVYSGKTTLDENGEAWIQLPEWFEALNTDFTYQLTCIGGFANVYIAEEIKDNRFKIGGGNSKIKVSWQVSGVRHDRQALEVNLPVEDWK